MQLRQGMAMLVAALICATSSASFAAKLDIKAASVLTQSLPRMACNFNPSKWVKKNASGLDIIAAKGTVIAAPSLRDPDYFFHWIRDSALIVDSLIRFLPLVEGTAKAAWIHGFVQDFIRFSDQLQASQSPFGLGDPRFNVDGSVDTIQWSRPQNDGPALRALALMPYLARYQEQLSAEFRALAVKVILTDLDYVALNHAEKNFDLWEYSIGHHFYTRVVQLGALEAGQRHFGRVASPVWQSAIDFFHAALPSHWNEQAEYYTFSIGPVFNERGHPTPQPGDGLDTSVVFAATHSQRSAARFSMLDDRLLHTAWMLENYFRANFPINNSVTGQLGPAIGRHKGDGYYGGNAFFFLTAGYAELYFRLAQHFQANTEAELRVTAYNKPMLESVLALKLREGQQLGGKRSERELMVRKLKAKGEAFIETILENVPANGMMAEQFGKVDGSPASATDLTWSYAALLGALEARENVARSSIDFAAIPFTCPL